MLAGPLSTADTFERSCAHWSEEKRAGMDAFYALATADYRHLAEAVDWAAFLRDQAPKDGGPINLLDVACGSGKFPTALLAHAGLSTADLPPIQTALLDPSAFSIAEARSALAPPFTPAAAFETTLQGFTPPHAYDVVWATHALYAIPAAELEGALSVFLKAIGGAGVIAHASESAHYITFYERFLADFRDGTDAPYATAEQIIAALKSLGATLSVREIAYTQSSADTAAVEGYLQRCVFDDSADLAALLAAPTTGPYLESCRRGDGWAFDQTVKIIFIEPASF